MKSPRSFRATSLTPTDVIDVHHHMFAPHLVAALAAAGVDRLGGEPVPASWSPEASLQVMDRYGIDVAILSTPVSLQFAEPAQRVAVARAVNDFGADCAHRWPQRFGFLPTLPLPDVRASVAELCRALDELGADGVAFLTNHAGLYQGDSRLDPVYVELDRRGAVSFIHPTVPSGEAMPTGNAGSPLAALQPSLLEFPFDTTRAVANLVVSGTLERFPRIGHIVTHCGGCVPSVANRLIDRRPLVATYTAMLQRGEVPSVERIETLMADAQDEASRRLGTLHYDVALSSDPHVLAALTGIVPPSQLLLGTDFPMGQEIGVHVTLGGLERFEGFDAAQRDAIRSTNPTRLFPRFARTGDPHGDVIHHKAANDPPTRAWSLTQRRDDR